MVLTRLEAEACQAREASSAEAQREAETAAAARSREVVVAQELETKAMERWVWTRATLVLLATIGDCSKKTAIIVVDAACSPGRVRLLSRSDTSSVRLQWAWFRCISTTPCHTLPMARVVRPTLAETMPWRQTGCV